MPDKDCNVLNEKGENKSAIELIENLLILLTPQS